MEPMENPVTIVDVPTRIQTKQILNTRQKN